MSTMMASRRLGRGAAAAALGAALSVSMMPPTPSAAVATRTLLLSGPVATLASEVIADGGQVLRTFPLASALEVEIPAGVAPPQGSLVIPNVSMHVNSAVMAVGSSDAVNTYSETIGVPADASAKGITVAVVDTGVAERPDIPVSKHINVTDAPTGDGYGHGTFLAGLIAGTGEFPGVAPDADILDVQVARADGSTDLATVLAGLQAVADERADDPSIKVVNLALSTGSPLPPYMDPLTLALNRLWNRGVTVVVASGNDGEGHITSPASDPTLIVVGSQDEADTALRDDDAVPDFSAYGSALDFERPDVVAPGVSLISTGAGLAYSENPASQVGDGYLKGSGTSMSAAVTSGALALLHARRDLSPDQAKRLIVDTAYSTPELTTSRGAGQGGIDVAEALAMPLTEVAPLAKDARSSQYGPSEADAAAWAEFSAAWTAGDLAAVVGAWIGMSQQTRQWAANAWALAGLARALAADEDTFDVRRWAGRRWASEPWAGRRWATDEWVGRRWATVDFDGRRWAGRRWASADWLAFAWTVREAAHHDVVERIWQGDDWDGRRWADDDWAGRRWADSEWVGRRWAADAWDGRRWADYSWDGRRWADGEWTGRRWADFSFEGRRWATEEWSGRRWAAKRW